MGVLKRRNRMVNFRLSEDEYVALKNICLKEGARSLSDFARAAVCRLMAASRPADEPLDIWVRNLDAKVGEIDQTVRQITEQMNVIWRSRPRKRIEAQECS